MSSRISEEELNRMLSSATPSKEKADPKKRWVDRMIRSAKKYHKICPYYDKKTGNCFIKQLKFTKNTRCDRDGRFDGCVVFIEYLEEKYEWFKSSGQTPPVDFRDLTMFV